MSLIAKDSGGGDFQPAPPGTHIARCYAMIDLGTQTSKYGEAPKVFIRWELVDERMDNGEPFSIGKFYTVSLHEKATLRRDLEAWRGRPFTPEELAGFDLAKIVGHPCLLNIVEKPREVGGTTSVVGGVMALPKGTKATAGTNGKVVFTLDTPDWTVYADLPEWLRKMIDGSAEVLSGIVRLPAAAVGDDQRGDSRHDDIPF